MKQKEIEDCISCSKCIFKITDKSYYCIVFKMLQFHVCDCSYEFKAKLIGNSVSGIPEWCPNQYGNKEKQMKIRPYSHKYLGKAELKSANKLPLIMLFDELQQICEYRNKEVPDFCSHCKNELYDDVELEPICYYEFCPLCASYVSKEIIEKLDFSVEEYNVDWLIGLDNVEYLDPQCGLVLVEQNWETRKKMMKEQEIDDCKDCLYYEQKHGQHRCNHLLSSLTLLKCTKPIPSWCKLEWTYWE